jgi:hypothetical protein
MANNLTRPQEREKCLNEDVSAVYLVENEVLTDVCNDIEAVKSDFLVQEVYEHRRQHVQKLEVFYKMVFVCSNERQVADDQQDGAKVLD